MLTIHPKEIDDKIFIEHVIALGKETKGINNLKELSDCRAIENIDKLTVEGTTNAAELDTVGPDSLLSILIPDSALLLGMARAYQAFSEDSRKAIEIFTDIQSALTWFSYNDKEIETIKNFINNAQQAG